MKTMRFEWVLGLSIAVHLALMIVISSSMDMLDDEDVPIKARVNIHYEFSKKKPEPIKKPILRNKPAKKNKTTEVKPEDQTSNIDPIRKKIAEQMKKDPEIISRALSYWLNQK